MVKYNENIQILGYFLPLKAFFACFVEDPAHAHFRSDIASKSINKRGEPVWLVIKPRTGEFFDSLST